MRAWINAIGYQIASLMVIHAAGVGQAWRGILACALFVALQFAFSDSRRGDLMAMSCAFVIGCVLDGVWSATGWVEYASPSPAWFAPAWIMALWVAFAMTFNHSLRWMRGRPRMAAVLGAVGGPSAYWGAERVFSAVTLPSPPWFTLAALAIGWALAVPLIAHVAAMDPATRVRRQGATT